MRLVTTFTRNWITPVAAACLVTSASVAQEFKSQYTSLQTCSRANRLALPDRVLKDGVFRCAGAGGYRVYVVEDDPRSFLVLERGKKLFSLEKPMSTEFLSGNFPNVSGAKKAEWRIDGGGDAVALIVRVAYQKADNDRPASTLLAFDLRNGEPVLIGAAPNNEEARKLADTTPGGGPQAEALSRDCNAIYAGLCKDFPPGPEQLGRCYDKRPAIADKLPAKCVADFQTNIENYHQAIGGGE